MRETGGMRGLTAILVGLGMTIMSYQVNAADFIFDPASLVSKDAGTGTLYMVGKIVDGDYDRFIATIRSWGPHPFSLDVRSEGGNVIEAMKIGRLVRQLSVSVNGTHPTLRDLNKA